MENFESELDKFKDKMRIVILPAFNDEWTVEVYDIHDELMGRFNAVDNEKLMEAIKAAIEPEYPLWGVN